jgi:hypothetical protein
MSLHGFPFILATAIVALSSGGAAAAEPTAPDPDTGAPLAPKDAAGAWTLESQGRSICVVKLGAEKTASGSYKVDAPASCGDALPTGLAGWKPAADGMSLVDASGQTLVGFGRWSNSLLVSHRSSGVDVQLRRGA